MRIDAHQHYWKISRGDYGWITPEIPKLYRDFLPEHLLSQLQSNKVDGTVLVQAAPTIEETRFILSLSDETESVLGVVGWLDLTAKDYKEQFNKLNRHPKFVGFRIMIQDMPNPKRVLEADFIEALTFFAEKDIPIDLLVTYDQLPILIELLDTVPGLRGVVDHLGKPPISSNIIAPWKDYISTISKHSNIYCKLSGMVTEADFLDWKTDDFVPYVRHVVNAFGTKRIMFGSDWPVCLQAANYDSVYQLLNDCLPEDLTIEDQANLFGNNARTFYKL